jgi:hypothetical protein
MPLESEDRRRLKQVRALDCPRRYCHWWHSVEFDWESTVAQGCMLRDADDKRCCRAFPRSEFDHFEPRSDALAEDGLDVRRWLNQYPNRPTFEDLELLPFSACKYAWRWASSTHDQLSSVELSSINALAPESALAIDEYDRRYRDFDRPKRERFGDVVEIDVRDKSDEAIANELSELVANPPQRAIVSWDAETAIVLPWTLFARRYSAFLYPVSDNAVVLPDHARWMMFCHHFEIIQVGFR